MDLLTEIRGLSIWVHCWFGSLTLVWFLSFIWMWQFSLCCLLFMVPFLLFLRWWYANRIHCTLNHVLKPFLHGYVNITLLAVFGQFIGLIIVTSIFAVTNLLFNSVGYLFYVITCIVFYVSLEEILKLYFNLKARDAVTDPIRQINKSHTITSTSTALGYSMCTGMLWSAFAAYELSLDDKKDHEQYSLFGWLFLFTLIIAVIGMPMHLITGYLTGCCITQKDIEYSQNNQDEAQDNNESNRNRLPFKSYIKVIYYPTFIRSAYLFFLVVGFLVFQFSAGGVIIALIGIILDYVVLIKHTKGIESNLPFDYLQRAGQLSIFGYNVLQDAPDSGDEENRVAVTAASWDSFAVNMEENMVIPKNDDCEQSHEELRYNNEDDANISNVKVESTILSDSDILSDTSSVR